MTRPPQFQARAKPETLTLFNQLHKELNGKLTKGELLDLVVSSASAAFRAGHLPITPPSKKD